MAAVTSCEKRSIAKNFDRGLDRTAFSRPRSQFIAIRTSQLANNIYNSSLTHTSNRSFLYIYFILSGPQGKQSFAGVDKCGNGGCNGCDSCGNSSLSAIQASNARKKTNAGLGKNDCFCYDTFKLGKKGRLLRTCVIEIGSCFLQ